MNIIKNNKLTILVAVLIFATFSGSGYVLANGLSKSRSSASEDSHGHSEETKERIPTTENSAVTEVQEVSVYSDKMLPDSIITKKGTTVQFNPKDSKAHEISYGQGNNKDSHHDHVENGISSGPIQPDEGYQVTFSQAGTYYFRDHNNPDAYITVVVYDPENKSEIK